MQLWQSLLSHLLGLEDARVVLAGEEGNESRMLLALLTSFLGKQIQQLSTCVYVHVLCSVSGTSCIHVYMYVHVPAPPNSYMYMYMFSHDATCVLYIVADMTH